MKKILVMLMAAALLVTAVACGSPSSTPSSSESPSSSQEPSSESLPPESDPEEEEKTLTGTILDATMDTVTVKTEDGRELSFALTDDTDKTKAEGMLVGSTIVVTYTGEITDADASAAVVTALEITAGPEGGSGSSQSAPDSSLSPAPESSESSPASKSSSTAA